MAGDPTREAAYALLTAVFERRRTLEDALNALPPMDARDRSAGHRLAAAVLRRSGTLDAVLEPLMRKAPPDPVRNVLRIGAAGLLLLEMPPHAAVGTAVALARTRRPDAVLRAGERGAAQGRRPSGKAVLETLDSPRLDTPAWLWASWGADARAIAEAHQHEAPLDLTLGPGVPRCRRAACCCRPVRFAIRRARMSPRCPGSPRAACGCRTPPPRCPPCCWRLRPGERIADLCAAPGGKTAQLAAAGAQVTAVERDPVRLARLAENLARWRLPADLVQADVPAWTPPELFDAVLLDAPCSATGTIRRHPDVPHLKRPRDIAMLSEAQDGLLGGGGTDAAAGRTADLRGLLVAARGRRAAAGRVRAAPRSVPAGGIARTCRRRSRRTDFCARIRGCGANGAAWTGFSPPD